MRSGDVFGLGAAITAAGIAMLVVLFTSAACRPRADKPAGPGGWLVGDVHAKLDTVARHLRGTDVAMMEIGHRYNELYWAGRDQNWGYAGYQAEKIRTALEHAIERRPKRAQSAEPFLTGLLPLIEEAVRKKDEQLFADAFETMTLGCNVCHRTEDVPFIEIVAPKLRTTTIEWPPTD